MVDITHKSNTLRIAIAQAIVKVSDVNTIDAIINKKVPKGDVFEMAKTAGLFAAKKTPDIIPDCHIIPIESAKILFEIDSLEIKINVEIKTIYKTGVEVEAMHAASVVSLTIYDMLKPIDKNVEIQNIKLISKQGGKSDFKNILNTPINGCILVCSDSVSNGSKKDKSGKAIIEKIKNQNINLLDYKIIPDSIKEIQDYIKIQCLNKTDLILITGGTGLSLKDVTPEAVKPLLDREIPGIAEVMRNYGQQRTPFAMLSRSLVGFIDKTLIICLPGSTKGAEESLDAIMPSVLHLYKMINGGKH